MYKYFEGELDELDKHELIDILLGRDLGYDENELLEMERSELIESILESQSEEDEYDEEEDDELTYPSCYYEDEDEY